jgi:hypothetical protein
VKYPRADRSQGWFNRAKTECPQGHPYDEENTYRSKDGQRRCKACNADRQAARRRRSPDRAVRTYERAVAQAAEALRLDPDDVAMQGALRIFQGHLARALAGAPPFKSPHNNEENTAGN